MYIKLKPFLYVMYAVCWISILFLAACGGDDDPTAMEDDNVFSELKALEGTWAQKADMPTSRTALSVQAVDGKIYVIGGSHDGLNPLAAVEIYGPATDTWTQGTDMSTARGWFASVVVGGKIYVLGGFAQGRRGGPALTTVEMYDPATDTWTRKADLPGTRKLLTAATVDGKIYAIGGSPSFGGAHINDVHMYDPVNDTWENRADMPTPRVTATSAVVDGKIYVIGGFRFGRSELSTVEIYDPATDSWTQGTDMPTRRWALPVNANVVNGKIYVIGGSPPSGATGIVEVYDPKTDTWTEEADMLTPRFYLSTATVHNQIYAIGGESRGATLATVEVYTPIGASNSQ